MRKRNKPSAKPDTIGPLQVYNIVDSIAREPRRVQTRSDRFYKFYNPLGKVC